MSDSTKGPISAEDFKQAFVEPVVQETKNVADAVGQAIESGSQAAQDPAQLAAQKQKEAEETGRKKRFWQEFIHKLVRQEKLSQNQQLEAAQKKQAEEQQKRQEDQVVQFEKAKKQKSFEQQHIEALEAKAERQKNVGG